MPKNDEKPFPTFLKPIFRVYLIRHYYLPTLRLEHIKLFYYYIIRKSTQIQICNAIMKFKLLYYDFTELWLGNFHNWLILFEPKYFGFLRTFFLVFLKKVRQKKKKNVKSSKHVIYKSKSILPETQHTNGQTNNKTCLIATELTLQK